MADVVFSNVRKVYPDGTEAVHDFELEIADGELVVLVGPSGCGKTTALRMAAGLEDITSGEISVGGRVVNDIDPRDRDVAMVFQNYALYPHMTVYDNIGFSLRIQKADKQERDKRIRTIARMLGLEGDLNRKPRQLSGGQRQRVAMGRAIIRQPQAFLMDEPLSNLDASLRFQMRAEIANLQAAIEVTTLYVTHDQVEAMTIGNRVAVMRRGRLLQFAEPQTIYDEPVELFVARFIGSPPMNLVESTLVRADGGYAVRIGSRAVRLDEAEVGAVRGIDQRVDRPVVAGIRPERLEDAGVAADTPAERRLTGQATMRETLGSDVLVHFDVDSAFALSSEVRAIAQDIEDPVELEPVDRQALSLIGRFSPKSGIRNGDRVEVALHPGAVQLFDPETGRSWRRDAEGDTR
ncbi:MAG TPA: ATP-binding cassette domain-containing protein [Gaiellaceae bacterium]|nr:ATP-binding cassette domain-containing protein [Gaiellaceae bacterium]